MELINVSKYQVKGFDKYSIEGIYNNNPVILNLNSISWNNSEIVSGLIRAQYSQDRVEAIINNHFLNISEWLDKKFKGEEIEFKDPEYEELQQWRTICKEWAKEALAKYPPTN